MKRLVYIEKHPFLGMVRSALATLKSPHDKFSRECITYLYGHVINNSDLLYNVENSQVVERSKKMPTQTGIISDEEDDRLKWRLRGLEYFLGDFHSHVPYWSKDKLECAKPKLDSDDDKEFLKDNSARISLIAAINETSILHKYLIKPNKISFTVPINGDKYRFDIHGYYYENGIYRRTLLELPEDIKKEL